MKSERLGNLIRFCVLYCLIILIPFPASGVLRDVPAEYSTIQTAIDSAAAGDTVLVQPGTYVENIFYHGKNIAVGSLFITTGDTSYISRTIISGSKEGSVVTFSDGEGRNAVLTGFTITNGNAKHYGGGIQCLRSGPTLEHLIVTGNMSEFGGGISAFHGSPIIKAVEIIKNNAIFLGGGLHVIDSINLFAQDLIIADNYSGGNGGGIYSQESGIHLENIVVSGNKAQFSGGGISLISGTSVLGNMIVVNNASLDSVAGGIYLHGGRVIIRNSTIADNTAPLLAGGMYCIHNVVLTLFNSIIWNNSPTQIICDPVYYRQSISVRYSDIQSGQDAFVMNDNSQLHWGEGNIDLDPLFLGSGEYPYQLTENSPCINAGTPDTSGLALPEKDIAGNARVFNGIVQRIDMGAFEYLGERDYNLPPIAQFTANPGWGSISTSIQFDASHSFDAEDQNSMLLYRWDWENDGVWDTGFSNDSKANHRFNEIGVYTVMLEIEDTGVLRDTAEVQIEVYPIQGQQYSVTIESDTSHIVELHDDILLGIEFYSGNVAGKKLEIVNYGKELPDSVHSGASFANVLCYHALHFENTAGLGAVLAFSYPDSAILGAGIAERNLIISFWDELRNQWIPMNTEIDTLHNVARTRTSHFSLWALTDSTDAIISGKSLRTVPDGYWSIQAAINASENGDTVLISPGIYYENINFQGKSITVGSQYIITGDIRYISETVINGNRNGNVVEFVKSEQSASRLIGLTITNGESEAGGGIVCANHSSPHLERLSIKNNVSSDVGGGICCQSQSSPLLLNIELKGNMSSEQGGAMAILSGCNPNVINSAIYGNMSGSSGGAIYCYESSPKFINVTISRNTAVDQGGGMYFNSKNNVVIANSIIWLNSPEIIDFAGSENSISVSYSNILANSIAGPANITWIEGNISYDPKFQSYDANPLRLSTESPCINAGDQDTLYLQLPLADLAGNSRIYDGRRDRVDMGAFEFQGEPSVRTPPLVLFSVSAASGNIQTIFTFDASKSTDTYDLDEELVFRWDWDNDGDWDTEYSNENTIQHQYADTGTYRVTLEVRNTGGITAFAMKQIEIYSAEMEYYSTVIESDTGTVSAIFKQYTLELKFLQGDVREKKFTVMAYPNVIPYQIHDGPVFDKKIGYFVFESNGLSEFTAILTVMYSDSTLLAKGISEDSLKFVYWHGPSQQWMVLPTSIDYNNNTVSTSIHNIFLVALIDGAELVIDDVTDNKKEYLIYEFGLFQNYPNPFNPSTTIKYSIKSFSYVTLSVFNLLGQNICTLVEASQAAGDYSIRWNGVNSSGLSVPSGVYLYRLETEGFVETRKMLLLH